MKQRAWLAATPTSDSRERDWRSRGQRIKDAEGEHSARLDLPDLGTAAYLADYLFEVGPTTGEHPVTWGELEAWQRATGVTLDEFEAVSIVTLSGAYLGMLHEARDPMCPPPFETVEGKAARRASTARRMKAAFMAATG